MGATTYEVDSSHVPMLSIPTFVIEVIRAAVAGEIQKMFSGGRPRRICPTVS